MVLTLKITAFVALCAAISFAAGSFMALSGVLLP